MRVCVLASGSSGNSTYVESNESKILVDAGISAKRISKALSAIGTDVHELDGVFITHEHTDHVRGLEKLRKCDVPVYMNEETSMASRIKAEPFDACSLDDLNIEPFCVSHDAANPVGFRIRNNGSMLGVITDSGIANQDIIDTVKNADALILESNHDIDMLLNGRYPYHLKQRILGNRGHLSNIDAGLLVKSHAEKLKTVFLAHLSRNNNTEELAMKTFSKLTDDKITKIMTHHFEPTDIVTF